MKEVFIVSAARTPMGSFMGSLASVPATKLGSTAIKGALDKISLDPKLVQEVYMGNVLQAGEGQAPARQAALGAGLSNETPSTTINKVCASGMKAVMLASQAIQCGDADIVIAGGMENMSLIPHYMNLRSGTKFGPNTMVDGMQKDGLTDAYDNNAMGVSADLCANKYNISREEQDAFAIQSYKKSSEAWNSGKFNNEVIPVSVPQRKGDPIVISKDEEFSNVNLDKIPSLNPAFTKEGTVTAANASTINDGAAALIIGSKQAEEKLGFKPIAKILSSGAMGVEPNIMGVGPVEAIKLALKRADLTLDDMAIIEINEAFASQVLGCLKGLDINFDDKRVNPNGGAIAVGHPLGASGARIALSTARELQRTGGKYAVVSLCIGIGQGLAMVIERV